MTDLGAARERSRRCVWPVALAVLVVSCAAGEGGDAGDPGTTTTTSPSSTTSEPLQETEDPSLVPAISLAQALSHTPAGLPASWIQATSVAALERVIGTHPGGSTVEWAERDGPDIAWALGLGGLRGDDTAEEGWGYDGRRIAWHLAELNIHEVDTITPWAVVGDIDRDLVASTAENDEGWYDLLETTFVTDHLDHYWWSDREMFLRRPTRDSTPPWGGSLVATDAALVRSFDDKSARAQIGALTGEISSVADEPLFAGLISELDGMGDDLLTVTLVPEPIRLSEILLPDRFGTTPQEYADAIGVELIQRPLAAAFGLRIVPSGAVEPFVLIDHFSAAAAETNATLIESNLSTGTMLSSARRFDEALASGQVDVADTIVTLSFTRMLEYRMIYREFEQGGGLIPIP